MQHVGIVGTGLIGASIGQGIRRRGIAVLGWDPDPAVLTTALDVGAIDEAAAAQPDVLGADLDLIVLAGPPRAVIDTVSSLATETLVMDVAGVKQPVLDALRGGQRFVATHPMAGRERSGPAAASAALFRGAAWVVCPERASAEDVEVVRRLIAHLGARVVEMSASDHDEAVAMVSHLPQVLAATLMTEATERTTALDLAAGSFRDLTRVASSDPAAWVELLSENVVPVQAAVADLAERLGDVAALLGEDEEALSRYLANARQARRSLAPPVVAVRVALADQPGEIARVGRALESSGVDLRDLQLRHAPHGGGGVLTLSVRPGDAEPLRAALTSQGLLPAD